MKKLIGSILCLSFVLTQMLSATPVHKGEVIELVTQEALSSETSHVGDQVLFQVKDDVKVGDTVVIQKGAQAFGEVSEVIPRKGMGRAGQLTVKGMYVTTTDGKKLRITFNNSDKPGGSQGWVWASAILLTPLSLFFKGSAAEIKKGTEVKAFLDEDSDVSIAGGKQAQGNPQIAIVGGMNQHVRTSAFLLRAHIDNAQKISSIAVNGQGIDFIKGNSVDIAVPIPMNSPKVQLTGLSSSNKAAQASGATQFDVPLMIVMEDGSKLPQDVVVFKDDKRLLRGKILKSDQDGTFISLGGLNGIERDNCFTVYKMEKIRDTSGQLVETVQDVKGYVFVVDVFDRTAKVELLGKATSKDIRPNDLIK